MLTEKDIEFIKANGNADVTRLLLGKAPEGVNLPLCAKCIQARAKMKVKAPLWWENLALAYPFSVSVEQGSSQTTALLKQRIIKELFNNLPDSDTPCSIKTADLTGGMGIDSYFISQIASTHYYFERTRELCEATEYNFSQLGATNIIVSNRDVTADGCAVLKELAQKEISLVYIDPARRTATGDKAILLQDYEPNVIDLQEYLFAISRYVLIKVSPMADIKLNLKYLPNTRTVYIVTVDNECRELLFLLDRNHSGAEPLINVILLYNKQNINALQNGKQICFTNTKNQSTDNQIIVQKDDVTIKISEEESATATYTSTPGKYLYEPGKGMLKAGAYKLISERYGCHKLAVSTHLYTSDEEINDFPGKTFCVEEVIPFNKKSLKEVAKRFPKADLTARNFPMDTNALKKLSGIKDGGSNHIFAVTLQNGEKVLIITSLK